MQKYVEKMIRLAKKEEIPQILELTKACAKHLITHGIFQWNEHYPSKEAFEKDVKREQLYVYELEGDIIGTVVISTEKDEEYKEIDWSTPDGLNYYIHRLAVHPKLQKQGKAKELMDFSEAFARDKKAISIRLDTFSKNPRNQRFYENRGYKKLGSIYFPKQSEAPFYCYELALI